MANIYLCTAGSRARLDGSRMIVERDGERISSIPLRVIESVVLQKNTQLTTHAIFELTNRHIPIFFLDFQGNIVGTIREERLTSKRLLTQVDLFRDVASQEAMAREVVREKISNQYALLKQYANAKKLDALHKTAKELKKYAEKVDSAKGIQKIRGMEGISSKLYFEAFPYLLEQEVWQWKGRSQHPAKDPVNALLNYGYAFLAREVRIAIASAWMDERIGFLHSNNGRKDSLTYDLMELFRQPIVDRFVLNLVNRKSLKPEDFEQTDRGCLLGNESRLLWCARYEEYMTKPYKSYDGKEPRTMLQTRVREFANHLK